MLIFIILVSFLRPHTKSNVPEPFINNIKPTQFLSLTYTNKEANTKFLECMDELNKLVQEEKINFKYVNIYLGEALDILSFHHILPENIKNFDNIFDILVKHGSLEEEKITTLLKFNSRLDLEKPIIYKGEFNYELEYLTGFFNNSFAKHLEENPIFILAHYKYTIHLLLELFRHPEYMSAIDHPVELLTKLTEAILLNDTYNSSLRNITVPLLNRIVVNASNLVSGLIVIYDNDVYIKKPGSNLYEIAGNTGSFVYLNNEKGEETMLPADGYNRQLGNGYNSFARIVNGTGEENIVVKNGNAYSVGACPYNHFEGKAIKLELAPNFRIKGGTIKTIKR